MEVEHTEMVLTIQNWINAALASTRSLMFPVQLEPTFLSGSYWFAFECPASIPVVVQRGHCVEDFKLDCLFK
jgi:hypothetical protein